MNYQLTYEDALKICDAYKNFNFNKTEYRIENFKIVTFNYFLCEYKWFVTPLLDEPNISAYDMRGVTFVFNEDGTLYKRFLMLKKFFNINQVEETQYSVIRYKDIKSVTIKEDGSLIAFMQLPNEKIFAKTQGGFTNEQAIAAMNIYNTNEEIRNFVNMTLQMDYTPLFEYVAYDNRIVLKYSGRELRLIGTRHNKSGEFISAINLVDLKIPVVKQEFNMTLDKLLERAKTEQNIEGWVIEFEDEQLVKIKCDWYCNLHGIRTVSIFREDYVIHNYLNETLDDAIQDLNATDDADAFAFIERIKKAVTNWSNFIEEKVNELVEAYNSSFYSNHWVKFATDKHKSPFFGLAKIKIESPELYIERKIKYMLNDTKHLNKAKKIVEHFEK
jgi:T4 RnlA family RNA ligase